MLQAPPKDAEEIRRGWPQGAGKAPGWEGAATRLLEPFEGLQPGAPALQEAAGLIYQTGGGQCFERYGEEKESHLP